MDLTQSIERDTDASDDQLALLLGGFNAAQESSDEGAVATSHSSAHEHDQTADTLLDWPDDPTNPVNRSSQLAIQILSNELVS